MSGMRLMTKNSNRKSAKMTSKLFWEKLMKSKDGYLEIQMRMFASSRQSKRKYRIFTTQ